MITFRLTTALAAVVLGLTPCLGAEVATSAGGVTYSVRVPAGYDAQAGARLVVGLHGQGGNHGRFMGVLDRADFLGDSILITPDASSNAAWEESDLPKLASLVEEVKQRFRVSRTVLFGFSRGAYCAFGLGLRYPQHFQAVIPHSGGLTVSVPNTEGARGLPYYVIHGDADPVVPVTQSDAAVDSLKKGGLSRVEYEVIPGLAHRIDPEACRRAFDWANEQQAAGSALSKAEAKGLIRVTEQALRSENWTEAAESLTQLSGAPEALWSKVAGLVRKALRLDQESLALDAIEVAGSLGDHGARVLKRVSADDEALAEASASSLVATGSSKAWAPLLGYLKADSEAVAVAAAEALAAGNQDGVPTLIKGLKAAEKDPVKSERCEAIREALSALTGASHETSREWSRWLSVNG